LAGLVAASVDPFFDVRQQLGGELHLVEDHRRRMHLEKAPRVFPGGGADIWRLQRHIPVPFAEKMEEKRRLAGLARTREDQRRELVGGPLQSRFEGSLDVVAGDGDLLACNFAFKMQNVNLSHRRPAVSELLGVCSGGRVG